MPCELPSMDHLRTLSLAVRSVWSLQSIHVIGSHVILVGTGTPSPCIIGLDPIEFPTEVGFLPKFADVDQTM